MLHSDFYFLYCSKYVENHQVIQLNKMPHHEGLVQNKVVNINVNFLFLKKVHYTVKPRYNVLY